MRLHPLKRYLLDEGISQAEFSRKSGVHRVTISTVLAGRRNRFSAEDAMAIEAATGASVKFADCWKPRHARKVQVER
jgi:transcriptional regulator with XRE-family HTH domain